MAHSRSRSPTSDSMGVGARGNSSSDGRRSSTPARDGSEEKQRGSVGRLDDRRGEKQDKEEGRRGKSRERSGRDGSWDRSVGRDRRRGYWSARKDSIRGRSEPAREDNMPRAPTVSGGGRPPRPPEPWAMKGVKEQPHTATEKMAVKDAKNMGAKSVLSQEQPRLAKATAAGSTPTFPPRHLTAPQPAPIKGLDQLLPERQTTTVPPKAKIPTATMGRMPGLSLAASGSRSKPSSSSTQAGGKSNNDGGSSGSSNEPAMGTATAVAAAATLSRTLMAGSRSRSGRAGSTSRSRSVVKSSKSTEDSRRSGH